MQPIFKSHIHNIHHALALEPICTQIAFRPEASICCGFESDKEEDGDGRVLESDNEEDGDDRDGEVEADPANPERDR